MIDKDTLELTDENGNVIEYEVLDIIEFNDEFYTVLYQADGNDTDVIICRVEDTDDLNQSKYIMETDKNIINSVYKKFKENYIGEIRFLD